MSNTETQKSIDSAENKLNSAIDTIRANKKEKSNDPIVEAIKEPNNDVEVVIDTPKDKEPRRSEFVQTDDPKVQERINDLYRQVKGSDARNQMIIEHNRVMEQKLAEYADKLTKFEQVTKETATSRVESELKAQLRMAREEGDFDTAETIEDKLLDLRVEKRLVDKLPPEKPKVNPVQQQFDQQFLNNARYLEFLGNEKDPHGNPVRPYLLDWHPDNSKAVELFTTIPKEFAAAGKQADLKTIMDVLDERIKGKKSNQQAPVLGDDGGNLPARSTIKLTQKEIEIARNLGITPERYGRQKQLMNT